MATATTDTTGKKKTPDLAQKIRERLAIIVPQGRLSSVDAVQSWVKAVWVLPVSDLLMAQFDLALRLVGVAITDRHDSPMPLPDL